MTHAAHAQSLRLRLFLEGIEIPVIAANVQTAPNSPSVCTIQIPPLPAGTKLLPRTCVHLFFLDLYRQSPAVSSTGLPGPDSSTRSPTAAERASSRQARGAEQDDALWAEAVDQQNDQWRLLFGGEVVGFTWTKNVAQRSLILQCEDWSNYWDYAYQADNTGIFGPGLKAVFSGAATNLFTDFLQSKGEVLTNILVSGRCNTFPALKGLAAGVVRLLEAIGGSYYVYPDGSGHPPRRRAGQNLFFSYNELRLHLTQLIGTFEDDPTSERILRRQGYSGMFSRALGGQGGQVSMRGAITAVTKIIFYEMYPQPCPKFRPGDFGETQGVRRLKIKNHPKFGDLVDGANQAATELKAMVAELDRFVSDGDFPAGNTMRDGSAQDQGTYRARLQSLAKSHVVKIQAIVRGLQRTRSKAGRTRGFPRPAIGAYSSAIRKAGEATTLVQQWVGSSFSNNRASAESRRQNLKQKYQQAADELNKIEDMESLQVSETARRPAQLYQQVFRPDVWFASPPRCNVLFPELYDNFSYQRMFLKEPTRFMLKTNDEFFGEDVLFDNFYFAPQAGTTGGNRGNLRTIMGRKELLDHERFTGILPVFEKMGEFNIFASKADQLRRGVKKIGLAQRSANFLYFRHRFNARRAQVSGKFNPYIAVGCPGLIIDKYVDRETLERHNELRRQQNVSEVEASEILGTNFLGNFTQVVHQISQNGPVGRTDITVTFPRQHDESIEFLGTVGDAQKVRRRVDGGDAVRSTPIAAISPPRVYSLGPNGGRIVSVQPATEDFQGKRLPVFASTRGRVNTRFKQTTVPVGVPVTANDEGENPDISELLGGNNVSGTFQAYFVTEEIPRYKVEEVLLPAEEYIRPGWYGDIWSNSQIGKVWQELFSTGSITDPVNITDQGRNSFSLRSEESQQAAAQQDDATDVGSPQLSAPAITDLQEGASISQAIEFLHLTYSYIRQANVDTDEFINAYTWRPIASMLDMFGTSDLEYDQNGESVIQGFEGFHSRAFGPYNNLFGLVDAEIEDVLGIKRGSVAATNVDVRGERRKKVEQYITSLLFSNALLG